MRRALSCLLSVSLVAATVPVSPALAEDAVAQGVEPVELRADAGEAEGQEQEAIELGEGMPIAEQAPQEGQGQEDAAAKAEADGAVQLSAQPTDITRDDEAAAERSLSAMGEEPTLTAQASNDMESEIEKLYGMVNQLRARNGLPSLTYDYDLEAGAKIRARELGTSFSHTRPNGQRFSTAISGPFTNYGENIVMHKANAREAFDRWDGSQVHHENMLGVYYNVIAIGFARVNGETYWAMELAYRSKPALSGASRIPVDATASYKLSSGQTLRVMKNGKKVTDDGIVSISGKTVTAKKAGSTTLYVYDSKGKEVTTKTVTVYALSGSWEFESPIDSNYVLDIKYRSKANTARMIVWRRNNQTNQRYQFERMGDGSYLIKCVHSGKFVDVQYGATAKQQPVIQWSRNARTNQRWLLTVDAKNHVTFICMRSKMCFDIQYGKVANGSAMIQWPSNGRDNQKWVLNKK